MSWRRNKIDLVNICSEICSTLIRSTFKLVYKQIAKTMGVWQFRIVDWQTLWTFQVYFVQHDRSYADNSPKWAHQNRIQHIRESSIQWDKGFMSSKEFHYNIYVVNTLMWCHYETFETQRLISRSLACTGWRNNCFFISKSYCKCSTLAHLLFLVLGARNFNFWWLCYHM